MGTRSLTHIKENGKDSQTICTFYRQHDGYLEGHGADLAKIIAPRKLVNGYQNPQTETNGMGCVAALVIAALKGTSCGGVYLYPPDIKDCGEEFTYTIYAKDGEVWIECEEAEFAGTAKQLQAHLSS